MTDLYLSQSERLKQERLLKKSMKQARKSLQQKGIQRKMASRMVKQALQRIAANPNLLPSDSVTVEANDA
jgi:hypothetical protein